MLEGYCGYCHDAAVMWCENDECEGGRKSVCKKCAVTKNCRCADCGERFIDVAEMEE